MLLDIDMEPNWWFVLGKKIPKERQQQRWQKSVKGWQPWEQYRKCRFCWFSYYGVGGIFRHPCCCGGENSGELIGETWWRIRQKKRYEKIDILEEYNCQRYRTMTTATEFSRNINKTEADTQRWYNYTFGMMKV